MRFFLNTFVAVLAASLAFGAPAPKRYPQPDDLSPTAQLYHHQDHHKQQQLKKRELHTEDYDLLARDLGNHVVPFRRGLGEHEILVGRHYDEAPSLIARSRSNPPKRLWKGIKNRLGLRKHNRSSGQSYDGDRSASGTPTSGFNSRLSRSPRTFLPLPPSSKGGSPSTSAPSSPLPLVKPPPTPPRMVPKQYSSGSDAIEMGKKGGKKGRRGDGKGKGRGQ